MADKASSDVSGLHAKLDRKRAVEQHNEETQKKFQMQFSQSIDTMDTQLMEFAKKQENFYEQMNTQIGNFKNYVAFIWSSIHLFP